MSGRIMMTPDELERGASTLNSILSDMNQQVQRLDSELRDISSRWEGMAQDAFMDRYMSELSPVLKQTMPQVIEALAQKLKAAADAIRTTDSEIAGAFRG